MCPQRPTSKPRHRSITSRWIEPTRLSLGLVGFVLLMLIAGGYFSSRVAESRSAFSLEVRNRSPQDKECRLVHTASDQCKFVRENCPDEEAGLISYLELYFCRLPNAKPVALVILLLWLGLLFSTIGIAASDFFSVNLNTIASLLGLSESVAGVTFLAFGNGSPDVFSTFAAMSSNSGSLAIGELIGAAGFITAVVAGSMALVRPFKVAKRSFLRDISFFIVAASFSMVFLADGRLAFWECAVMVIFYVTYVIFVVVWHWILGRRRLRKQREARSRDHFLIPDQDQLQSNEELDYDREHNAVGSNDHRRSLMDDFAILEGVANSGPYDLDDEDESKAREQWMSEINRNMRVQRPILGSRRNTANPIRPSLVGALEFRAILSSLEKSRSQQAIPIGLRRYSDDPVFTMAQQQQYHSRSSSNPQSDIFLKPSNESYETARHQLYDDETDRPQRNRAVSANDSQLLKASQARHTQSGTSRTNTNQFLSPSQPGGYSNPIFKDRVSDRDLTHDQRPVSTNLSPASDSNEMPAPLGGDTMNPQNELHLQGQSRYLEINTNLSMHSLLLSPGTAGSSPAVPFPPYYDDPSFIPSPSRPHSIRLPPPSLDPGSFNARETRFSTSRPLRWWPYRLLPSPSMMASTLFPTLYSWKGKGASERILGIVSSPAIFLLTITLPVVEPLKDDDYVIATAANTQPASLTTTSAINAQNAPLVNVSSDGDDMVGTTAETQVVPGPLVMEEETQRSGALSLEPEALYISHEIDKAGWNRWLVSTQVFTAPLFVVLILWANLDEGHSARRLLLYISCSLLGSLIVFTGLILTTSEQVPPRYHSTLCFVGFVVSIAWIATIAGEVVGVLKALGVILGISDAILGLTIFAVGNSLGDLVANITVAKLGFPVMALSACFGGPMLNILLGIGLSGLYLTLKEGGNGNSSHTFHSVPSKSYHIEISGTLVISGVTLLITLVGLLVAVPLNKWVMDRKIGWSLVVLWSLSTIANVVVDLTGMSRKFG